MPRKRRGDDEVEENSDKMSVSRWTVAETCPGGGGMQCREVRGAYLVPLGLLLPCLGQRTGHGRHWLLSKR